MIYFRSLAYHLGVLLWTLTLGALFLPLLLFAPKRMAQVVPYAWTRGPLFLARRVCGIRTEIRGAEHILPSAAIYAMKHQSAWETLALWHILPAPVFVLKRELFRIPVFGWYLARMPVIAIDRAAAREAMKSILAQAAAHFAAERQVIIFPEGTRTRPGTAGKYKSGIAALAETFEVPVIPVALNSGVCWPRNSFLRRPGTIVIHFLPPMTKGLSRDDFMTTLCERMETASLALL